MKISQVEPDPKDACLCGSGKIFKKCCRDTYNTDIKDHFYEYFNDGKYNDALRACRSWITWYILCHRAHTVPLLNSGDPKSAYLLEIDVDALSYLVSLLHRCYYKTGQSKQFPKVLGTLSNAIKDSQWQNIIVREMAFWHLIDNDDSNQAFKELEKIDISTCTDVETLTLYLDVSRNSTSFRETINLIDRILANTHKEDYILQYASLKGLSYCLIGEIEDGCNMIDGAIARYKNCEAGKKTVYGNSFLASNMAILGVFKDDPKKITEAIEIYTNQLDSESWTNEGISVQMYEIAKCYSWLGKYDESIKYYNMSLQKESSEITKVFFARSLINSGAIKEGRELLVSIRKDDFDDAGNYDYAISWSVLAFNSKEKSDIDHAKEMINQAKGRHPLFENQKREILLNLSELKPTSSDTFIKKVLKSLNRYILLRPSIFGVGININRIIEDTEPKILRPTNHDGNE
ncbi:MAG: hypothetical protein WBL85_09645 [Sedimentisphaerales bacterium]